MISLALLLFILKLFLCVAFLTICIHMYCYKGRAVTNVGRTSLVAQPYYKLFDNKIHLN